MKYIISLLFLAIASINSAVFADTGMVADTGIIVRTSRLMAAPSFSSDLIRKKVKVGWEVEMHERKGGWQKVKIIKKDETGWVRYYQVRTGIDKKSKIIRKAKKNKGVLGGLAGWSRSAASLLGPTKSNKSRTDYTATVGIRGLGEKDINDAEPNIAELKLMRPNHATAAQANQFAAAGHLQSQEVAYLIEPEDTDKKKKKKEKKKHHFQGLN